MSTTPDVAPVSFESSIGTLLATVTACVCTKLRDAGRPACDCCLVHGASVMSMDGCSCDCDDDTATGRVTGRVLRVIPAPSAVVNPRHSCLTAMVQVTLQIGVFRCITIPEDGAEPGCDVTTAEALGFLADEQAMRAALACCADLSQIPGKWQLGAGEWEPHGPSGGCAGGVISVNATGAVTFPQTANGQEPRR